MVTRFIDSDFRIIFFVHSLLLLQEKNLDRLPIKVDNAVRKLPNIAATTKDQAAPLKRKAEQSDSESGSEAETDEDDDECADDSGEESGRPKRNDSGDDCESSVSFMIDC